MQWHGTLRACLGLGGLIVARDKSARGVKEYTVVPDVRAALDLVRAAPDAHCYEHMADAPCTLYFDIDL